MTAGAPTPLDPRVEELLDKQEIREQLARWCRGLDRGDVELMRSVYHDDVTDIRSSRTFHGANPADDYVERHRMWKRHLHFTMNELIDLDGDVARCESYFMAHLVIEEDGVDRLYQHGGRHLDRFERREGAWKIAYRLAIIEWRTVTDLVEVPQDISTPGIPFAWTSGGSGSPRYGELGRRSRDDPSYGIP